MLIFEKAKLVYLANPKTGTTSIVSAFRPFADFGSVGGQGGKHTNFAMFQEKFPYFEKRCEVVVNVKDPLATLFSWFKYRQREQLAGTNRSTIGMTFEQFVAEWSRPLPPQRAKVSTSTNFILTARGKVGKATFFRYNTDNPIHPYLEKKLGQQVPQERMNVSPKADESFEEASRNIDRTRGRLAKDYKIFNSLKFYGE